MIPENYWKILRRWFWLIAIFGIAAGALTYFYATSTSFGQGQSYNASTTLGVSRVVTYNGGVVSGFSTSIDSDITSVRAESIMDWARTPQFISQIENRLREQGLVVLQPEIYLRLRITAQSTPGLITVSADGATFAEAQSLVDAATSVLQERTYAEEQQVLGALQSNLDSAEIELRRRLAEVYDQLIAEIYAVNEPALRQAMFDMVTRGTVATPSEEFATLLADLAGAASDPDLIVLRAQVAAVEANLGEVSSAKEDLNADLQRWEQPLIVVFPTETVQSDTLSRLRKRDVVAMGGVGGLVVGWVFAGFADRAWTARSRARAEIPQSQPRPEAA